MGILDFFSSDAGDFLDPSWQLSKYFTVENLTVTNSSYDNRAPREKEESLTRLAYLLDEIYDKIGPFNIASAYRSFDVNADVGGAATSRHLTGEAADISPTKMSAEKFWGGILLDPDLMQKLGHVAFKKHQRNAIHITLPFMSSSGLYIKGVPQVTAKIGTSVSYLPATQAQMDSAKNIFLGITEDKAPAPVLAGFSLTPMSIGIFLGGMTALGLLIRLKRKT